MQLGPAGMLAGVDAVTEFIGKVEVMIAANWAVFADPHFWIMVSAILTIAILGIWIGLGRIR